MLHINKKVSINLKASSQEDKDILYFIAGSALNRLKTIGVKDPLFKVTGIERPLSVQRITTLCEEIMKGART